MFYDIVFFLSPEAVAAGAKISLMNGQYIVTKAAATTIQAINGGRPPVDQSAEVAALTQQVAQLTQALADCQAGNQTPAAPIVSNVAANPNQLPVGGGPVSLSADTSGGGPVTSVHVLKNGVDLGAMTLPATIQLP